MKPTLMMLGAVALVVILIAIAVHVWADPHSRLYLIGAGVAGGVVLAYAGWQWKRSTRTSWR